MKSHTRSIHGHASSGHKCGILGVTTTVLTASLIGISSLGSSASALTEQRDVNVSFTFNSTLSVSVSNPDLVIDDLVPGTAADSNIINVNVLSNSPYGYTLNSTVGSTTYNTRNLTHSTSPSSTPFSSINYGTTVATKESLDPSQWGYSYSLDNGTTWINTNKTNGTTNDTGYSGLPLYSDTTNIATLKESNSTTSTSGDNVKFKIAAKADTVQIAGEYNNVINFQVTGNPEPAKDISNATYLQEVGTCPSTLTTGQVYTLKDNRDEQEYKVAKLADNKCWMLDNLRLDPSDSTTLNNITALNTNADATSIDKFKNGGGTSSDQYPTAKINNAAWTSSSQNYYSIPMTINTYKNTTTTSYGAGSGKIGVYYNYCAASAGSYCYGNGTSAGTSSGNATEDLCPAGWRMPTGNTSGEYKALYDQYSSASEGQVVVFQNALSTPLSGYFVSGSASSQGSQDSFGGWWSSTRHTNSYMRYLYLGASSVFPSGGNDRTIGFSLRCVTQ